MEESHKGLIEQRAFIFFFPPDENSLREAERSIRRARLVASHRLLARSLARETERERERVKKKKIEWRVARKTGDTSFSLDMVVGFRLLFRDGRA